MSSQSQSDMLARIQHAYREAIERLLKVEQSEVQEDLASFEQSIGVDQGGGQPSSGKDRSTLGIHQVKKVG